jgi:capsular exopolysaccharide synthesis family protein
MKTEIPSQYRRATILLDEPAVADPRVTEFGEAPSLRDYWLLVRKHQRIVVICFLAALAVTALILFSTTPLYTAKATLLIERKEPQVVNIKQVISEPAEAEEDSYYESQYQILQSRSLAAEVIKNHALDKNPRFTASIGSKNFIAELWGKPIAWLNSLSAPMTPPSGAPDIYGVKSQLIDSYQSMLEVEPIKRSRLVRIGISAPDPMLAANVANAHASTFVRQGLKLRSEASEEARKFLEAKLTELRDRVQKSEDGLNRFRRDKGIISLDDKENIVVDRLADLNKRLTESEAERIGLEAQASLIKKRQYDTLPAVIDNPLIQTLKSQVVELEAEHAKLAAQFLPGYPRLAQLNAQLKETRSRLARQIKSVVEGINSAYLAAAGKERELRAQMEKQKSEALALKDAAVNYAILARDADTNKQLYESVLERFKEINVAGEIPASNVSILDRAEIPSRPSKPNKRLNLMLGAFLGLMGGLGLALLLEHLDNTLRTPEEVEQYLRLQNLVIVPDFFTLPFNGKGKSSRSYQKAELNSKLCVPKIKSPSSNRQLSVVSEAYRKLRTSIALSRPEEPPKTILFTSGTAGEGKTVTAANTAIMFAVLGNRVLLMDADLRRPTCHKVLKIPSARGLVDYLAGHEHLDNAIKPTSIPNLSILNGGSIPSSPTELIGSIKMQDTLALLKDRYDFIFIDCPPVLPVSDAVVLSTLADGLILVVRGQKTPKQVVREAVAQLGNTRAKILGVVLNRVDIRKAEYKHYYRYYHAEYYSSAKLT